MSQRPRPGEAALPGPDRGRPTGAAAAAKEPARGPVRRRGPALDELRIVSTQAAVTMFLLGGTIPVLYHGLAAEALSLLLLASVLLVLPRAILAVFRPAPNARRHPVQATIATVFWLVLLATALALLDLSGVPRPQARLMTLALVVGAAGWVLGAWMRRIHGNAPATLGQLLALGGLAWSWHLQSTPPAPDTTVAVRLPWDRPTRVLEGGPSALHNHNVFIPAVRNAVELAVHRDGPPTPDDHAETASPSWDVPVLAPADGEVVLAVDGDPDGAPGSHGTFGNQVILRLTPERFLLLGHLRQGSLLVQTGDRVLAGQPLARCGSSGTPGARREAHLHLQAMTQADLRSPTCTTLPLHFTGVTGDAFARQGALLRNLP